MTANVSGSILTGGNSTRMGQDKALLFVGGLPLAARVGLALKQVGVKEVVAIGGDQTSLCKFDCIDRAIADDFPGEGPLGGIITALRSTKAEILIVLACDTPGITSDTPAALLAGLEANPEAAVAVAFVEGQLQPLTAAWRTSQCLTALLDVFVAGERSPRRALTSLLIVEVRDVPVSGVHDVDQPSDLDHYAAGSLADMIEESQ
ncbi:MAG: molybdenum cofactor guanylyltransferase [Acidimicrobiales bacterium]